MFKRRETVLPPSHNTRNPLAAAEKAARSKKCTPKALLPSTINLVDQTSLPTDCDLNCRAETAAEEREAAK